MGSYTMLQWLLSVTLVSLLYLLIQKGREKGKMRYKTPPGPRKFPIIGNLHLVGKLPHRSLWLLSQKYGPLMHLELGCVPTLVVSSAEMAREVLKTHDLSFCSRPSTTCIDKYSYNGSDISFSPYGKYWREMRKISILELFSIKRVESFRAIRREEVSRMVQSISGSLSDPINMRKAMVSLASNAICRTALGRRYENSRLHVILEEVEALSGSFWAADYFPGLRWFDKLSGLEGRLDRNAGELDDFYEEVIKDHLDPDRIEPEHEDIVDVLLRLQKDAGQLTMNNIKAVLTVITFLHYLITIFINYWILRLRPLFFPQERG